MKTEQKIFVQAFVLIIIALYIVGYLIIYNNHNNNITLQVNSAIEEYNRIFDLISQNYEQLKNSKSSVIDFNYDYAGASYKIQIQDIAKIVSKIIENNYMNNQKTSIYLYSSGNLLVKKGEFLDEEILNEIYPTDTQKSIIIKKINEEQHLFVSSRFTIENIDYELIISQNITDIYDLRDKNISFFIRLALGFSIIGALILFFSIHIWAKKLRILQKGIENSGDIENSKITVFEGDDEISSLSKSITKLQQKASTSKEFIDILAHEIRRPICIVNSSSQILLEDKTLTQDEQKDCIEKINNSIKDINKINNSLMELLNVDIKKPHKAYVNVSKIVLNTCQELENVSKYKKIQFVKNIQKNVIIFANEALLKLLVKNIIINSIEASNFKGRIEVYVNKNYIKIVDFGCGIPEDKMDKIKEVGVSLKKGGIGLGLYLCEKIASIHDGNLQISNNIKKSGVTVIYYFRKENMGKNE